MGVLTYIDNMPLFETLSEARNYANENGLTGYHVHVYEGRNGYMAGTSHAAVSGTPPPPPPSGTSLTEYTEMGSGTSLADYIEAGNGTVGITPVLGGNCSDLGVPCWKCSGYAGHHVDGVFYPPWTCYKVTDGTGTYATETLCQQSCVVPFTPTGTPITPQATHDEGWYQCGDFIDAGGYLRTGNPYARTVWSCPCGYEPGLLANYPTHADYQAFFPGQTTADKWVCRYTGDQDHLINQFTQQGIVLGQNHIQNFLQVDARIEPCMYFLDSQAHGGIAAPQVGDAMEIPFALSAASWAYPFTSLTINLTDTFIIFKVESIPKCPPVNPFFDIQHYLGTYAGYQPGNFWYTNPSWPPGTIPECSQSATSPNHGRQPWVTDYWHPCDTAPPPWTPGNPIIPPPYQNR